MSPPHRPSPSLSPLSRTLAEAAAIASSLFYEGIESFDQKEYQAALVCFEQALAINQKYFVTSSSSYILCCNNIAAVHDRLGDTVQAVTYYEKAQEVRTCGEG